MKDVIHKYFASWISKDIEILEQVFAKDIVCTECYGPEYHGLDQILRWFEEWNQKGSVLGWIIKREIEKDKTIVVEWYFKCDYQGKVSGFDGVTIADFNKEGKIFRLKEFRSDSEHIYPYE